MRYPVAVTLTVLFTAACADKADSKERAPAAGAQTRASAPAAASAATVVSVAPGGTLTGTLREQIPVGPYVYVRLETANGDEWAAVNEGRLVMGEPLTVYNVMKMEQFNSPTLGRTFARIYFGMLAPPSGDASAGPAGATGASPRTPGAGAVTTAGAPDAIDAHVGRIARATGTNAFTISELWMQKSSLVGKTITVRGVVVKYNSGVMGKNWIHLQDGSGKASDGTIDLTATSQSTVAVGDTVTVTGTVRTNKDFGAGYTYALVVEEANVVR
jgi:hypothetical protein